jgi:group I intron endonuclease
MSENQSNIVQDGKSNERACIYALLNLITKYRYVGQTNRKEGRWGEHRSELEAGAHCNPHLQNAWNTHGSDAFIFYVLEFVDDLDKLKEREQFYLDFFPLKYNICPASGSRLGVKDSEETRKKKSKAQKGNQNALGHIKTEEVRRNASERMKGKQYSLGYVHTEETRRNTSERMKGKQHALGYTHTEKERRNMSERMKGNRYALGNIQTEEQRRNMSERMKGNQYALGNVPTEEAQRQMSESQKARNLVARQKVVMEHWDIVMRFLEETGRINGGCLWQYQLYLRYRKWALLIGGLTILGIKTFRHVVRACGLELKQIGTRKYWVRVSPVQPRSDEMQ